MRKTEIIEIELKELDDLGSPWGIKETEKTDLIPQPSGNVQNLDKLGGKKETSFIIEFLIATIGIVFVFSILWGAFTKDWTALENIKEIIALILSYLK